MSSETTLELYKRYATEQDKYVYFLLAAAGAGIGFVVQRTDGALITWPQLAAGLAVLFWGLSFWSGCRHIRARLLTVYNNMTLNQLYNGTHPMQPHPRCSRPSWPTRMHHSTGPHDAPPDPDAGSSHFWWPVLSLWWSGDSGTCTSELSRTGSRRHQGGCVLALSPVLPRSQIRQYP
jgi:hypothetical protein